MFLRTVYEVPLGTDVPIRNQLIDMARTAAEQAMPGRNADVVVVEMSQQERVVFMNASADGKKPAQATNHIDNLIAVLSGKGGVGKSSVAALLAVALRRQGREVGVLEGDRTGPSIPRMFGLHGLPPPFAGVIVPARSASGIEAMSINLILPDEQQAVIWRGPLISGAIKQFCYDVLWGHLDFLVVDLPPGTSDAPLTVMQSIPLNGLIFVTSPQELAGMLVTKAARMSPVGIMHVTRSISETSIDFLSIANYHCDRWSELSECTADTALEGDAAAGAGGCFFCNPLCWCSCFGGPATVIA